MKKIIVGAFIFAGIMTGCAPQHINSMSTGVRRDVFREAESKEPIPAKYAELTIITSLKTRKPENFSWTKTSRGTPDYMLLLNIDGQATWVKGDLAEEKAVSRGPWNSEAGEGIRYFFTTKLWLEAGHHTLFVALPEDGVYMERDIALKEGIDNNLNLTPVYGKRKVGRLPALDAVTSFYEGIRGFDVFLNGKAL